MATKQPTAEQDLAWSLSLLEDAGNTILALAEAMRFFDPSEADDIPAQIRTQANCILAYGKVDQTIHDAYMAFDAMRREWGL